MYVCRDCCNFFQWPKQYVDKHGLDEPPYERYYGCPRCGGAYSHAPECALCGDFIAGEYVELADGEVICEDCYSVHNNLEDDL